MSILINIICTLLLIILLVLFVVLIGLAALLCVCSLKDKQQELDDILNETKI